MHYVFVGTNGMDAFWKRGEWVPKILLLIQYYFIWDIVLIVLENDYEWWKLELFILIPKKMAPV